jgi:agmatinase
VCPDLKRFGVTGRGKSGSTVTEPARFLDFPAPDLDDGGETLAAVLGIPHGVAYSLNDEQRDLAGAPAAVRAASQVFVHELDHYDFDLGGALLDGQPLRVVDGGDVAFTFGDGRNNSERARGALREIIASGTVPLVLGGDDSIPPMLATALAEQHRFHVVTVDAHLDFRDEIDGEREGRSSPARRMLELPQVLSLTQIGLRGIGGSRAAEVQAARSAGSRLVVAGDVHRHGLSWLMQQLPVSGEVLLSIDCDGLDPSVAPGTGWPQPGGLSFRDVAAVIDHLGRHCQIVGADVVEFLPSRDVNGLTALTVCRLLMLVIGQLARRRAALDRP